MPDARTQSRYTGHDQAGISCLPIRPSRSIPDVIQDAHSGLLDTPRSMPPKYFYDEQGSRLFDAICNTPEYYPTRTEAALLDLRAQEIITAVEPEHIVEFGSGTSRKTRALLDACDRLGRPVTYWPFDVCESVLVNSARALKMEYDWLDVRPLAGDYHGGLDDMRISDGTCLYLFLGGTIGNFEPDAADLFIAEIGERMQPRDGFLLGADRVKHPEILHAAYNDAAGITAEFNLNLLHVLNRALAANFDVDRFSHRAIYNAAEDRIEMYLVARETQKVRLGSLGCEIRIAGDEAILTEISRKFTCETLEALLDAGGFSMIRHFEAGAGIYSLVLAQPAR